MAEKKLWRVRVVTKRGSRDRKTAVWRYFAVAETEEEAKAMAAADTIFTITEMFAWVEDTGVVQGDVYLCDKDDLEDLRRYEKAERERRSVQAGTQVLMDQAVKDRLA